MYHVPMTQSDNELGAILAQTRMAVSSALVTVLTALREAIDALPKEHGVVSGVEYVPLHGNAPHDIHTLIQIAIAAAEE